MKILYVASSGGHWEELMCLKELFSEYDSVFFTEEGGQAQESVFGEIYTCPQINRKETNFFFHLITLFRTAGKIIKKESPDIVITTGALIAFPICLIQKIKKKKVIFIESFARVTEPSLTGKLCYRLADAFLIQWEGLKKAYPKAIYVGGIF